MTSSENLSFFSPEYSSPRMLPIPPTPPPKKQRLPTNPSPKNQEKQRLPTNPSPENQEKQRLPTNPSPENQESKLPTSTAPETKPEQYPVVLRPPRRKTNPMVWCGAILCLIFSLLLIFFGVATLIIFLAVKPRTPAFDTPAASLNFVYLNSLQFLNGEFSFVANFSNPNRRLNVRFESLEVELFFSDSLIATQILQPFSQREGEVKLIPVHLISSLVYLPPNHALGLQRQVLSNRIVYNIRGTFKVRFDIIGLFHYSYWLHGTCQVEMTGPPNGVLITHTCKTKR
nr:NDR1/HIN1-like protein 6 [Ipomoea batatas]GMC76367.1 NDR1/HIN1-like protein 6 [Ipomoea batatas]GME07520.1 NDR1/HIN1-like protein 6 [Ipomoea batatas]